MTLKLTIQMLRVFWRPYPLAVTQEPDWAEDDSRRLGDFLRSGTGQKLMIKMRFAEQSYNVVGVAQHNDFSCGTAVGFRAACSWLHAHSETLPPQVEDNSHSFQSADELAESLAP